MHIDSATHVLEISMNEDPRVVRTKMAFENALLDLMMEQEYEKISVSEIAAAAGLNRSTFYLHYSDKEDLLEKYLSRSLDELKYNTYLHPKEYNYSTAEPHQLLVRMFEHMYMHKRFYRIMMADDTHPRIQYSVRNIISVFVKQANEIMTKDGVEFTLPYDFRTEYVISAFMGTIVWWIKNGMPYEPKYFASLFTTITTTGMFKDNPYTP